MKPLAQMSRARRLRKIKRYEAAKDTPTRTHLAELGAALNIPAWGFCLQPDKCDALIKGQWPDREAIAEARAIFESLDP